jgi:general stress protein 26
MSHRSDLPTPDDPEHTLWSLIEDLRLAMLTTRDAEGRLRSRPMTTQNLPHADGLEPHPSRLWFFLSRSSQAAGDLRRDPRVNLAYASPEKDRYVSVSGSARFVDDLGRKQALWSAATEAWFQNGADDPDVGLLEVRIDGAEFWDVRTSKVMRLAQRAKAAVTGEPPSATGTHARIGLH